MKFCAANGIIKTFAPTGNKESVSVIERLNRDLQVKMRAFLHDGGHSSGEKRFKQPIMSGTGFSVKRLTVPRWRNRMERSLIMLTCVCGDAKPHANPS